MDTQIGDPTSQKPRIACRTSRLGISVTRDHVTASSMYKTELCRNFLATGKCRYGVDCIFAHGSKDRKDNILEWQDSTGDGKTDRNRNVANETHHERGTCRFFFSKKGCPYGEMCIFGHQGLEKFKENRDISWPSSVINIQTTDFDPKTNHWLKTRLCNKWMMLNSCEYGAKCIYAHGQAELRRSSTSLGSEFENTWTAPRTSKKDALPPYATKQTAKQKVPETLCLFKWKTNKKIVGIYADWVDEKSLVPCSGSEQVQ